jgi:hypothetical protein
MPTTAYADATGGTLPATAVPKELPTPLTSHAELVDPVAPVDAASARVG